MVSVQRCFLAVTNAFMTVNDRWPVVSLSSSSYLQFFQKELIFGRALPGGCFCAALTNLVNCYADWNKLNKSGLENNFRGACLHWSLYSDCKDVSLIYITGTSTESLAVIPLWQKFIDLVIFLIFLLEINFKLFCSFNKWTFNFLYLKIIFGHGDL